MCLNDEVEAGVVVGLKIFKANLNADQNPRV
jgi:hypothetical protein